MKTPENWPFPPPIAKFLPNIWRNLWAGFKPVLFFSITPPLARSLLFWAHSGALWCTGALFQTFAKYLAARHAGNAGITGGAEGCARLPA